MAKRTGSTAPKVPVTEMGAPVEQVWGTTVVMAPEVPAYIGQFTERTDKAGTVVKGQDGKAILDPPFLSVQWYCNIKTNHRRVQIKNGGERGGKTISVELDNLDALIETLQLAKLEAIGFPLQTEPEAPKQRRSAPKPATNGGPPKPAADPIPEGSWLVQGDPSWDHFDEGQTDGQWTLTIINGMRYVVPNS